MLLDEYQDTGHAQVETLRGLFGDGHPVTAVGDPFQSIYGWRGASAGNIGRFAADVPARRRRAGRPCSRWRRASATTGAILAAANAVAAPLRAGPHDRRTARRRRVPAAGPSCVARLHTVEDEARWVAARLRAAWDALPAGGRTAAVLVRRRSQIPLLAEALQAEGLPVEVVGLGGLLTTPEVVDVVATLRVLVRHDTGTALARLLTGARWRIGAGDLAALCAERGGWLARCRRADAELPADRPSRSAWSRRSTISGRPTTTPPRATAAWPSCPTNCAGCAGGSARRCPNWSPTSSARWASTSRWPPAPTGHASAGRTSTASSTSPPTSPARPTRRR